MLYKGREGESAYAAYSALNKRKARTLNVRSDVYYPRCILSSAPFKCTFLHKNVQAEAIRNNNDNNDERK